MYVCMYECMYVRICVHAYKCLCACSLVLFGDRILASCCLMSYMIKLMKHLQNKESYKLVSMSEGRRVCKANENALATSPTGKLSMRPASSHTQQELHEGSLRERNWRCIPTKHIVLRYCDMCNGHYQYWKCRFLSSSWEQCVYRKFCANNSQSGLQKVKLEAQPIFTLSCVVVVSCEFPAPFRARWVFQGRAASTDLAFQWCGNIKLGMVQGKLWDLLWCCIVGYQKDCERPGLFVGFFFAILSSAAATVHMSLSGKWKEQADVNRRPSACVGFWLLEFWAECTSWFKAIQALFASTSSKKGRKALAQMNPPTVRNITGPARVTSMSPPQHHQVWQLYIIYIYIYVCDNFVDKSSLLSSLSGDFCSVDRQ